jgi:glutamate synthase (ferredoxin)
MVVKVISKMGVSTIQSYCGAQVFEALGLNQDFVDRYFTWTPSRIGSVGLNVIAEGAPHDTGAPQSRGTERLDTGGGTIPAGG